MGRALETCSGLCWTPSGAASWTCCANVHVYNVWVAQLPDPPKERSTLRWLTFVLDSHAWRFAHVQVNDGSDPVEVHALTVDGTACVFRAYEQPPQPFC